MYRDSGAAVQHQQQTMEFADEEEELLRDHEQSLRQLEVLAIFKKFFSFIYYRCQHVYSVPVCNDFCRTMLC